MSIVKLAVIQVMTFADIKLILWTCFPSYQHNDVQQDIWPNASTGGINYSLHQLSGTHELFRDCHSRNWIYRCQSKATGILSPEQIGLACNMMQSFPSANKDLGWKNKSKDIIYNTLVCMDYISTTAHGITKRF